MGLLIIMDPYIYIGSAFYALLEPAIDTPLITSANYKGQVGGLTLPVDTADRVVHM